MVKIWFFRIAVRVGGNDLTKDKDCDECELAVEHDVEKAIPHENYSLEKGNDIGLLKLKTIVSFHNQVNTICLPIKSDNFLNLTMNEKMEVMGFGKNGTGKLSNVLMKTYVPYVPLKICKELYKKNENYRSIHNRVFCAGDERHNPCKGKMKIF